MTAFLFVASIVSWLAIFVLGFLLLGTLRALGLLTWRLEQLETTTPKRLGRDGLKPGKKAPDFVLPGWPGLESSEAPAGASRTQPRPPAEVALHDFAGRKVLLVFTQAGCGPCARIMPELNRLHDKGALQVLVVNNGEQAATRQWAADAHARFPVLAQTQLSISKLYQVFATPFAFLIDERGIIASKGLAGSRQYLGYVLSGAGNQANADDRETNSTEEEASNVSLSNSFSSKEVSHV
jgi:methylamine dehydrogenase accessory protein MauD